MTYGQSGWTRSSEVSKFLIFAIISAEDARFYEHRGIDLLSIRNSIYSNLSAGKIVRGASTITQQVVRLALLSREKSYLRKLREIWGALLLELLIDKEHILEWYLNMVNFGNAALPESTSRLGQTNGP